MSQRTLNALLAVIFAATVAWISWTNAGSAR